MRNHSIDVIRGIAVLGLMYMNAYSFGLFEFGYVASASPPFSDHVIKLSSLLFVDGRFRSLFCILFGVGLYIQWQRNNDLSRLTKRLKILAVFGLLHGFLLWAGDILFIYACAGWVVIKYLDAESNMQLKRGFQFLLLGSVITVLLGLLSPPIVITRDSAEFLDHFYTYSESGSSVYLSNMAMFGFMLVILPFITVWMTAGLMLLGIYAYKNNVFENGLPKKVLIISLFCSGILSCTRILLDSQNSTFDIAILEPITWFSALFMALIIIHVVVKLVTVKGILLTGLQSVGRLALTLYIMQSVLLVMLFKMLYPEWVLTFDRIDYWLIATSIALFQLVFSVLYRRYFDQGPLEFIWRKLAS